LQVFTSDGSAKSLLVDEKMSVAHVTRILAEKNHVQLDPKWALVELVPDLYMERVYEDHEQLVDNCLLWKVDSKNTLWFIERPEKFDLFLRPEVYLLGTSSSQKDDQMEEHSRQELLEEYFSSSGVGAPQLEGNIYLKADSKKSWKKFYFVLRTSGLYYAPKGKKSSKDLVCLTTFDVNQVYYGVGWKNKYKAPTDFCFGIKHPQIQAKNPKYIKYLCVESQRELHQWVTGIRIAKNGKSLYENYRGIVEEITHADIDILTSKRFSVNSTNGLQIAASNNKEKAENGIQSPARTPSSENKSLASALSSGFESDLSNGSSKQDVSKLNQSVDTDEGCSGSGNDSTEKISAGLTPVGTLERSFKLRRSFSRSSRSSSGSGCMSDKSGAELGFESDFPLGGTIKKRPTTTPRLPLTNTTWGLVKESDQENDEEDMMAGTGMGGGVVGVGAGGTLLRRAVRNSVRKPKENSVDNVDYSSSANASPQHQPSPPPSRLTEVSSTITLTAIDDPLSQAFERSLSSMSEDGELPLPPPPRMDSISSLDQIDQLPPPPADMVYNTAAVGDASSHYHVSPVSSPLHAPKVSLTGLPPAGPGAYAKFPGSPKLALPPAVKKPVLVQKSSRRISFDDNVQMIEAPSSPVTQEQMYLPGQNLKEKAYAKFTPAPPYRGNPKKLVMFNEDPATNTNSLPRRFINDLQRVMNKKWQVAEKCRSDRDTTPHEVLGFRDEQVKNLGQQGLYSQKSAIGAWVLDSQQYTPEELEVPEYQGAQQAAPYQDPYSGNKTYTPDRSLAAGHRQDSSPSQFQHSRQESPSHNIYGRQESPIQHHVGRQESPGSPYHQQLNQHQESPSHYSALHHHHTQQQQQHRQESPYAGFPNQLQQNSHHQQHQLMMAGHSPQSPQHHIVHHHMHHASPQGHHPHNSHHASPVHHGLPLGGVQSPHHHFHHGPVAGLPPPHSPQHNGAYGMNGGSGSHSPASSGSGGGSSHGSGSQQPKPVVLIEPEPNYVDPSRMRANKGAKRPPPPPRRNDNTQLTAAGY
jgi:amyloid beta A4 precursor protein-binding family B protein 1-interacting protein